MNDLVMAVDVGTGSARAAVFDRSGCMLGRAEHPIRMNKPNADVAEQSSEDIWQATCTATKEARALAGAQPSAVKGISFDTTCSLVLRDSLGWPLSVSENGDPAWDTMAWLDHRAQAEAEEAEDGPKGARAHRREPALLGIAMPA